MTGILLVTGGSRGIGAAIAKQAALAGYKVCVNYRENAQCAEAVVQEIQSNGGTAIAIQADVSQEKEVIHLFNDLDSQLGTITALVNNAGILKKQMRLDQMDAARINKVFQTNVTGAFLCAKEAVLRMSTQKGGQGGVIINMSSASAYLGSPNEYIDYAASKGAIDTMTKGLALEVAKEGIRVNTIRPGLIETEIHADGGMPDRVQRKQSIIPLQRGGTPSDVSDAVMYLLSDKSSYVTGSFINVTGGL